MRYLLIFVSLMTSISNAEMFYSKTALSVDFEECIEAQKDGVKLFASDTKPLVSFHAVENYVYKFQQIPRHSKVSGEDSLDFDYYCVKYRMD